MKENQKPTIYIIGAGISGLIAAKTLEEKGYIPTIIEATTQVGGRVKTDIVEGFQTDHGFQVLLDAYPLAIKHLDYPSLSLQKFKPGASLFKNGTSYKIGDPTRDFTFLLPTLTSPVGSIPDKLKILKLNSKLKAKSIDDIFESKEVTTLQYLKDFGFSDKIIQYFFRPFFTGIFLESDLSTSSRMFEFVYKMFGAGLATLPKGGIGEIANQLLKQLKTTQVELNTPVEKIQNQSIFLKNGEVIDADFIIVATDPSSLIPNMVSTLKWKSCDTLYFKTKSRVIDEALIGLNTRADAFVNNIFYHSSIDMENKGDDELLSVTVVKEHDLPLEDLILEVKDDLKNDFGISDTYFIKHYFIRKALPDLSDLQYSRAASESLIMERVALAGDHQLNGSLNAAMVSGELAAEAADEVLSGNRF